MPRHDKENVENTRFTQVLLHIFDIVYDVRSLVTRPVKSKNLNHKM